MFLCILILETVFKRESVIKYMKVKDAFSKALQSGILQTSINIAIVEYRHRDQP